MKNLKLLTIVSFFVLASTVRAQPDIVKKEIESGKEVVETTEESSPSLKPFFTDGCTLFVDGPVGQAKLWRHCCVEHDLRYWFGGSKDDRNATDLRLRSCVKKAAGAYWANLIYYGVKTGQFSPIKNKTHWNWGWKEKRKYAPLTSEEKNIAKTEVSRLTLSEIDTTEFLKINFP